jgi:S-DNA-T family DNA segregation ATPase FtsK/SpoIIIE
MAKRKPARGRGPGRGRAATSTKKTGSKGKSPERATVLAALRERLRRGFARGPDAWGISLVVVALLLGLATFGLAGPVGSVVSSGLRLLFGVWRHAAPAVLLCLGVALLLAGPHRDHGRVAAGFTLTFLSSLGLFHLMTGAVSLAASLDLVRQRGGAVGSLISFPLRRLVGFWGAFVVLVVLVSFGVLLVTRATMREVWGALMGLFRHLLGRSRRRRPVHAVVAQTTAREEKAAQSARPRRSSTPAGPEIRTPPASKPAASRPLPRAGAKASAGYQKPPLELLGLGGGIEHSKRTLEETARELENTLLEHGVDAHLTRIVPGPTVTRYEIELSPGVKVARVTGLAHDIAYALATPDVRILAPIPGRSAIGVEVPNRHRRLVTLGDILRSREAEEAVHPLEIGLGMDISGRPMMLHLGELPHVLIAGATGAGKSSCINALVTSLLMRTTPDQVRLILIDPKRVELGQYNDVPHLLTRVITNPKKAADALQWAVREMERRYDCLADAGVRDVDGYHEKFDAGGLDVERFDRFPFIVVVVDELNDLMMVAGRVVEEAIVRIAQMARAVGIHLAIATQRPSVDVITGVIKANIPSRLAFSVASQTDSRVILDMVGAEKLVGLGDMIMVTARDPKPERVQGAWVSETEIHAVAEWVRGQRTVHTEQEVMEVPEATSGESVEFEGEDPDVMRQAIEMVVRSQLGSTSMLQRKLRIGFARAGRVMDIMEHMGIVGPSEGSKARAVLVNPDELEQILSGDKVGSQG